MIPDEPDDWDAQSVIEFVDKLEKVATADFGKTGTQCWYEYYHRDGTYRLEVDLHRGTRWFLRNTMQDDGWTELWSKKCRSQRRR